MSNNCEFLPSSPDTIVVYMSVVLRGGCLGPVFMARAAIRYFHVKKYSSLPSPTDDPKVVAIIVALRKQLGKPVVKHAPISYDVLNKLILHFLPQGAHSPKVLIKFRWGCFYTILFYCSARFEQIFNFDVKDLVYTYSVPKSQK